MSQTNGNAPAPKLEDLREQVRRERLQARLAQATHERQLWESLGFGLGNYGHGWGDFASPFNFRRDDAGGLWLPLSQGGVHSTKDGRNEPFVQSDSDLDSMRSLAYWLTTRNDLAIGAARTIRNLTIKQGYKWEAKPAKGLEEDPRALRLAAQVQYVIDRDADLNKLPGRERSSCWRAVRDGEALVRHFPQNDGTTRHRFVRAEQLRDPGNRGPCASFGVETDEHDVEEVLFYHVTYDGTSFDRVPAGQLSHLKRNVDDEIKRGVSDFYSAGEVFDEVAKLLRGMRRGATLLSKIAWIEEFANTTTAQLREHASNVRDLRGPAVENPVSGRQIDFQYMPDGKVIYTKDNKKYVPPPLAANTSNFVSVVQAALRAVGVRWGFPEYFISGDASNNAYSSILVSGSPLVNGIECEQDDFGQFFLRWRWVAVRNACERRVIDAPFEEVERLVDVTYTPPQVAIADEAGQAQIDKQDVDAKVMSKAERARRRNLDWELMKKEIAEEAEEEKEQGGGDQPPGGQSAAPVQESMSGPLREQYGLVLELL